MLWYLLWILKIGNYKRIKLLIQKLHHLIDKKIDKNHPDINMEHEKHELIENFEVVILVSKIIPLIFQMIDPHYHQNSE